MENMEFYQKLRAVPEEAKKTIQAGKLKGFTDINPMWRIKMLTELFGPCGFGWYTEVINKWAENGGDGKTAVFVELNLYVKKDNEWSKPIYGIGGSMLVNVFKGSQETSDEAYKMAYTDALSIACKALGMAADVYYDKDRTKYNTSDVDREEGVFCSVCKKKMEPIQMKDGTTMQPAEFLKKYGMCPDCFRRKRGDCK